MSSLIVDVCEVAEKIPHPNADRVELIRCKGWTVVSQKGQFEVGDKAVYFPPDTVISEELAERFGITKYVSVLPKNSDGTRPPGVRIRAQRFRGEQSFGFITKPDDPSWPVGLSVVDHYQATKFEPIVRDTDGDAAPDVPGFHAYTDLENIKNFPDVLVEGEEIVLHEKMHGTNAKAGRIFDDYLCGSRTTNKKPEDASRKPSLYWKALTPQVKSLLDDLRTIFVKPIVHGEILGAKVQDMQYGMTTQKFVAFDISVDDGNYLNHDIKQAYFDKHGVEYAPELYRGPYSREIVAKYTDGPTTLCDPDKAGRFGGREGCVIRPVKERYDARLPHFGRVILKSISIDYLERKGGTEDH